MTREIQFTPHMDNSSSKFVYNYSNGVVSYSFVCDYGVGYVTRDSYWVFETGGYESQYYGGHIDFGTTERPWIEGTLRGNTHRSFSIMNGRKAQQNNTNNDSNQTGTYAKMNGFTLETYNGSYDFNPDTELLLYKFKES